MRFVCLFPSLSLSLLIEKCDETTMIPMVAKWEGDKKSLRRACLSRSILRFVFLSALLLLAVALTKDNNIFRKLRRRKLRRSQKWLQVKELHEAANLVKGKCVEFHGNDLSGITQWGNYILYYYAALMYIVQAGASSVKMPRGEVLGFDGIRGTIYRPLDAPPPSPDDDCVVWHPKETFLFSLSDYGSMQDLYNFRDQWETIMGTEQRNPFVADFGLQPAMATASQRMDIPWEDVIVLHMRGGDAQATAQRGDYMGHMQPPCSYYEDIVETGDDGRAFPYVLVITERKTMTVAGGINPCAAYIEDRYRSGLHATKLVNYDVSGMC